MEELFKYRQVHEVFLKMAIGQYSNATVFCGWCSDKQDATMLPMTTIGNLRRKTLSPISCPRTSTPRGIAITSVADQLESRQSSLQVMGSSLDERNESNTIQVPPILRPVTELSRMALDRQALKKDNLVRPLTELARLGMDRWLNSTVMTKRSRAERIGIGTRVEQDFNLPESMVASTG